jgi:hypothetical protein
MYRESCLRFKRQAPLHILFPPIRLTREFVCDHTGAERTRHLGLTARYAAPISQTFFVSRSYQESCVMVAQVPRRVRYWFNSDGVNEFVTLSV